MAGMLGIDGNIDVNRLEKDLRKALDFDIKYKQTDNMKKRACKVATDYDEFKAMVACAHLKTLSRKEITSLGTTKKGWQKSSSSDKTAGALILGDEVGGTAAAVPAVKVPAAGSKKPKSPMELDRDLRRCTDADDKARYLAGVGAKRVCRLLEVDANAELFEVLLGVVLHRARTAAAGASSSSSVATAAVGVAAADGADEEGDGAAEPAMDAYDWFDAFAAMAKFGFMTRFLSKDTTGAVAAWIEQCARDGATDLAKKYVAS